MTIDDNPALTRRRALAACGAFGTAGVLGALPRPLRAQSPEPPLTLGVVPYFAPSRLEEIYAPAAAELTRASGRGVAFRTAASWARFFEQLKAQAYDIAFVHALFYVPAADEFGYLPLVRMREPFTAVILVPEGSAVRSVEDLRDQVIATPPNYLPTVHLAKKTLRDRGLGRGSVRYEETRTVDACLQQMLVGQAQACAAPAFTARAFAERTGARLRVLAESQPLPSPAFLAHRRVPEPLRERLRAAMLDWNGSPAGQAVLRSISTAALVPAADADYQPVRQFVRALDEPWLPSVP